MSSSGFERKAVLSHRAERCQIWSFGVSNAAGLTRKAVPLQSEESGPGPAGEGGEMGSWIRLGLASFIVDAFLPMQWCTALYNIVNTTPDLVVETRSPGPFGVGKRIVVNDPHQAMYECE